LSGPTDPAHGLETTPGTEAEGNLSHAQEQLWFLNRLMPSAAYSVPAAYDITGPLDTERLRAALQAVVDRHTVLRTGYEEVRGRPRAVPHPPTPLRMPVIDLTGGEATEREEALGRAMREECARPVGLAGPLQLRATLFRLGGEHHVLLLLLHHIAVDGLSLEILLDETCAFYRAGLLGASAELPPLTAQFVDHVRAERDPVRLARDEKHLDYWKTELAGLADLELPSDRPRPVRDGAHRGGLLRRGLPPTLAADIEALAVRERVSPFMVALAAFAWVLHRHSGAESVPIGVPGAGRGTTESAGMIGLFVNMLVIRTRIDPDLTFAELLRQTRATVLRAVQHQDVPFSRVVEAVRPPRTPGANPLFQVAMGYERAVPDRALAPGVTLRTRDTTEVETGQAKFDLDLMFRADGERSALFAEYSTELFDAWRIEQLLDHLTHVLVVAVSDPALALRDIGLFGPATSHRLAELLSGPRFPSPSTTLHELFAEQARERPHQIAAECPDGTVTYAELDAAAEATAAALRRSGTGPGHRVAVRARRSVALLVAVLGVLKAGAAYVPVDPDAPRLRTRHQLAGSSVRVLVDATGDPADEDPLVPCVLRVTAQGPPPQSASATGEGVTGVGVTGGDATVEGRGDSGTTATAGPDDLAYVLYTSGSTGRPKGVLVPHRAAVDFVTCWSEQWGVGAGTRVVQFSSLTFDVSVLEIFTALCRGGVVCMPSLDTVRAPHELAAYLRAARVEVAALPPTVVDLMRPDPGPALRVLSIGGEPFSAPLAARWCAPGRVVLNEYGPTETTVIVASHECSPDESEPMPFGRPRANTHAYVVDGYGGQAPIGVPGELWLGGAGLALGYENEPGLTKERFVDDPFVPGRGTLYRTGDRCYLDREGRLYFTGRLDTQVKVRGFRVELSEVETVLAAHPQVRQAAVRIAGSGENARLVAYLVPGEEGFSGADLRGWAGEHLPYYMVPSAVVPIDAVPLTAHGKVDHAALPEIADVRPDRDGPAVEPRTDTERVVAGIYASVLGLDGVGAYDGFFDLGGTSLQIMRLLTEVRDRLGVSLPVGDCYAAPTVAALAERIESAARDARGADRPAQLYALADGAGSPEGTAPLLLVHPSAGTPLCYAPLAQQVGGAPPVWGVAATALHGGPLPGSSAQMAREYAELIAREFPGQPVYVGGWSFGGVLAHAVAEQLSALGHEAAGLVLIDSVLPTGVPPSGDVAADFLTEVRLTLGEAAPTAAEPGTGLDGLGELKAFRGLSQTELQWRLRTYDAIGTAVRRHRPGPVAVPTLVVSATGTDATAEAWDGLLTGPVRRETLTADHYGLLNGPAVAELAALVREFMAQQRS
jgi:amino acid adenylation domain-containing protein